MASSSVASGAFAGLFAAAKAVSRAPKSAAVVPQADSFIRVVSTGNNVHVAVSDIEGGVISRSSGGMVGFKHRNRASPQAMQAAAREAAKRAVAEGYRRAHLELRGPSSGRGELLQGILQSSMMVVDIRDTTPVPTPGVRQKKARRL
jgi:small subunit ribosomal protein S11